MPDRMVIHRQSSIDKSPIQHCILCGSPPHTEKMLVDQCRLITAILGKGWKSRMTKQSNIQIDNEVRVKENTTVNYTDSLEKEIAIDDTWSLKVNIKRLRSVLTWFCLKRLSKTLFFVAFVHLSRHFFM